MELLPDQGGKVRPIGSETEAAWLLIVPITFRTEKEEYRTIRSVSLDGMVGSQDEKIEIHSEVKVCHSVDTAEIIKYPVQIRPPVNTLYFVFKCEFTQAEGTLFPSGCDLEFTVDFDRDASIEFRQVTCPQYDYHSKWESLRYDQQKYFFELTHIALTLRPQGQSGT